MKYVSSRLVIFCAIFVVGLRAAGLFAFNKQASLTPAVQAQNLDNDADNPFDRARKRECVATALAGRFSYIFEGSVAGLGENRAVGVITLNADGTLSAQDNGHLGTRPIPNRTFTGTYTVRPDCTGSASFTTGTAGEFVVDDSGNGFKLVLTTPGVNVTGIGRRIWSLQ
jgi:hypothetical protein